MELGCKCGCFREKNLRKVFQTLSRSEQDIFLMAQLKAMNGGEITASRRLKKKTRTNKRTFYYWDRNTRKVNLFGIQDEAVREQINYTLDEDEIIGKGLMVR